MGECGHVAMDIDTTTDREGATTLIELSTQSQQMTLLIF